MCEMGDYIKKGSETMERENIAETKELRTLEIDIEKNIFKINGNDIKQCQRIDVVITPKTHTVTFVADTTVMFETKKESC